MIPKIVSSTNDVTVSGSSTTTIVDEDVSGILEFIMVRVQDKNMNIILEIDGVEKYDLNIREMKDDYRLRYKDNINAPITVDDSGKQFFDIYRTPADIRTNITIKVKNNNTSLKKVYAHFVKLMDKG